MLTASSLKNVMRNLRQRWRRPVYPFELDRGCKEMARIDTEDEDFKNEDFT